MPAANHQFIGKRMKTLLRSPIEADLARLEQRVGGFIRQLADFVQITALDQQGQFTFLRRLLNYDNWRVAGRPQSTQFLDYHWSTLTSKLNGIIFASATTSFVF